MLANAVDRNDASTVLSYAFPEERQTLSLDKAKVEYLLTLYSESTSKKIQFSPWQFEKSDKDQVCILDHIGSQTGSLNHFGITFTLNRTNDSICSFVVPSLVFGACRNANLSDLDRYPEKDRLKIANIRGLRKLAPELKLHGIMGTLKEQSLDKVITWDQWIDFWSKLLKRNGIDVPS